MQIPFSFPHLPLLFFLVTSTVPRVDKKFICKEVKRTEQECKLTSLQNYIF